MNVITLNKEIFFNKCTELVSKTNFRPDIIVGVLNGGGYIVNEIKKKDGFEKVQFEFIKLQRSNWLKRNLVFKFILKLLPNYINDKLRVIESEKARKSIDTLNLYELSSCKLNFQFNSASKEEVKNILIIDDAIDTGKTMFIVKSNLNKLFPNAQIKNAVISWTIESSIIKPDYYLFKNVLVRFPWSKDYKGKDFEKKSFSS